MKNRLLFVILAVILVSSVLVQSAYCDDALKKLGRGICNCVTFPFEIFEHTCVLGYPACHGDIISGAQPPYQLKDIARRAFVDAGRNVSAISSFKNQALNVDLSQDTAELVQNDRVTRLL